MAGSRPRFKIIGRSGGSKACGSAAYRAADKIIDETYGETRDFTGKKGVLHSEIMAPDDAPAWVYDRQQLWNAVEQSEMKKDGGLKVRAQLARDILVPLPHELDLETNREALREWVQAEFISRGMIADLNIHAPDKDGDQRNFHAHIMLTMREITPEGFNPEKLKSIARDWNKQELLDRSIERWQAIQNRELERAGLDVRADFSSFESRGIDREPEQHEGVAVTAMKRKNKETRVGQENEARRDRNAERASQHMKALHQIVQAEEERQKFAAWVESKEADLATYQHKTMSQLEREQETEAIRFEDRVQEVYAPSLKTVQAEAERMEAIVSGSGIIATARRLIRGRRDREHLEALQMTIADTQKRMQEMRGKLDAQHRTERERLAAIQATRAREQAEGMQKATERKEAALKAKQEAAERQAKETAKRGFSLAEGLEKVRQSRAAWKKKQEENRQKAHAKEQAKEAGNTRARQKVEKDSKAAADQTRRFKLQGHREKATDKMRHQTPDPQVVAERQQHQPRKARSRWQADQDRKAADRANTYQEREAADQRAKATETAAKMEALRPAYEARQEEIRRNLESIKGEIERQNEGRKDKGQDMDFEP